MTTEEEMEATARPPGMGALSLEHSRPAHKGGQYNNGRRPPGEIVLLNAPAILVTLDSDWRVVELNRFTANLTGIDLDEARGKDWFATFVPAHAQTKAREVFKSALDQADACDTVTLLKARDGTERQIEWRLQIVPDVGQQEGLVVAVGLDVT